MAGSAAEACEAVSRSAVDDDEDDFCVAMDAEGRIDGTCEFLDTRTRVVQLSTGTGGALPPARCANPSLA